MQIGIDFGSTYSTVSKFNPVIDNVEAITLAEGEPASIPSVVSVSKKGQITCGAAAKTQVGKKTVRIFEAFKMLLTESNEQMLCERGYDRQYSPRTVTRAYLDFVLRSVLHTQGETGYENIVICVPEIWCKNLTTLDGRGILRAMLREEIDLPIGSVRVVTEPEAASAFYAYHYEKMTKKAFNGHLLLIDYGGGTLDITLTEVSSDGNGRMEIGFRESGGAGENHPDVRGRGTIGSAGIAFQQTVVTLAMQDAGLLAGDAASDYTAPGFIAAVRDLESQLKSVGHIREIEDEFGQYGSYKKMKGILDDEPCGFIDLEYDGEELPVTYQHLFRAYQDCIEKVLDSQIREINARVEKRIGADPCRPESGARDDFKIALVGGFGSFFLVRAQIAEIYHLDPNADIDLRTRSITADKREQAISLGAALIAAGKVVLKKTARYSIGLCTKAKDGAMEPFFAIRCHQDIEPGHPYFLLNRGAKKDCRETRAVWAALAGNIESFAIEFTERTDHCAMINLKPEIQSRLRRLPEYGLWNCGFSIDENDVVSFHLVPVSVPGMDQKQQGLVIPLDSYANMFDLTAVKEVTVHAL